MTPPRSCETGLTLIRPVGGSDTAMTHPEGRMVREIQRGLGTIVIGHVGSKGIRLGAALLTAGLLLGACGGGGAKASALKGKITVPATNSAPSTAPSGPATTVPATAATTAAPATTVPPTTTTALSPLVAMNASAAGYLQARENYLLVPQAKPYMTPQAYAAVLAQSKPMGNGDSAKEGDLRHFMWSIRVSSQCVYDQEVGGGPVNGQATILCALTDTTVTASGQPVPTSTLNSLGLTGSTLNGPQPQAALVMRQVGTAWLVSSDQTGQLTH